MQKNVLKKSINHIGISEGDVIKIPNDCGVDYYQYKNGKFFYLCCQEQIEMEDCEIFDLLSGDTDFEIIARGEESQVNTQLEFDMLHREISILNNKLDKQLADIKQEKEQRTKKDLYDLVGTGIFFLLVSIILLIKLFI